MVELGYYSVSEIAAMALPGMPKSPRAVRRRVVAENWRVHVGFSRRRLRGQAVEYSYRLLPIVAQCEILRRSPEFQAILNSDEARKLNLVSFIEGALNSGIPKTALINWVAANLASSSSTIRRALKEAEAAK